MKESAMEMHIIVDVGKWRGALFKISIYLTTTCYEINAQNKCFFCTHVAYIQAQIFAKLNIH